MTEFYVHIENEIILNPATVRKAFKLKDGWHKVKIENANNRSSKTNRYFHGPMLDAVFHGLREMGFANVKDKEDAKYIVKALFLKRHFVNESTGDVIEYIKDTHDLNKQEMYILIEDVIRWGAEYLGIQISYPNEQLLISY